MLRAFLVLAALVAAAAIAGVADSCGSANITTTAKPLTTTTKAITTMTTRRVTTTTTRKPSAHMCHHGMLKTEIASILAVHNKLRTDISEGKFVVNGTKMPAAKKPIANLRWNCTLERAAKALAVGCKIVPNMSYGQNVYFYNGTTVLTSGSGLIATAAGIWAGEFAKYGWPSVNYTSAVAKLGISEATQMAWSRTRHVGCGVASCNAKKSALVVCKYRVEGNKLNMNVYPPKPTSG